MKRSIDFYVTVLGFFYDHGIREMAWLSRDDLLLTLSPAEARESEEAADTSSVGFNPECGYFGWRLESAEALEQAYGEFHNRRLSLSSPPDPAQGRPWFFLYDPDGYPISFSLVALEYPAGKP
jgi:catechol 2,3-dioxygenase-like lactoylglutathione lyase family enzyme